MLTKKTSSVNDKGKEFLIEPVMNQIESRPLAYMTPLQEDLQSPHFRIPMRLAKVVAAPKRLPTTFSTDWRCCRKAVPISTAPERRRSKKSQVS